MTASRMHTTKGLWGRATKKDGTKGIVRLPELIMVVVHSTSVPAILFVFRRLNEKSTTRLAAVPVHMYDPRYYVYALLMEPRLAEG